MLEKYCERRYSKGLHIHLLPSGDALTFGFTEVNAIWNSLALVLHAFSILHARAVSQCLLVVVDQTYGQQQATVSLYHVDG